MIVISVVEDEGSIEKTLTHPGLWEIKERLPPKAMGLPKIHEYSIGYAISQLSESHHWLYVDPEYSEAYRPLEGRPT